MEQIVNWDLAFVSNLQINGSEICVCLNINPLSEKVCISFLE